jgi:Ca2+-binding EF-hand superfamily protein
MSIESSILEELNHCRANPQEYSSNLHHWKNFFQGKDLVLPNCPPFPTVEGQASLDFLIETLSSHLPGPELLWSEGLFRLSHSQNLKLNKLHSFTQETLSQSDLELAASKHCVWAGQLLEVHSFGGGDPNDVLIKCLLSDGDSKRQAFKVLMNKSFKYVGISFNEDPGCLNNPFGSSVTFVLAEELIEEKTFRGPLKKARAEEYVKVKEITLKDKIAEGKSNLKKIPGISHAEMNEIKEFFDRVATEHEVLNQNEFRAFIDSSHFSNSTMFSRIKELEIDKIESLDFESFVGFISSNLHKESLQQFSPILGQSKKSPSDLMGECKEMFDVMDTEKSGFIDSENIKHFLEQNESQNLNLAEMLSSLDVSHSEKLDFATFLEKASEWEASGTNFSMQIKTDPSSPSSKKPSQNASYSIKNRKSPKSSTSDSKAISSQCHEVFQLLDLTGKGKISAGSLKKLVLSPDFLSDFPVFCANFHCDLEDSTEITLSDLFRLCSKVE